MLYPINIISWIDFDIGDYNRGEIKELYQKYSMFCDFDTNSIDFNKHKVDIHCKYQNNWTQLLKIQKITCNEWHYISEGEKFSIVSKDIINSNLSDERISDKVNDHELTYDYGFAIYTKADKINSDDILITLPTLNIFSKIIQLVLK